MKVFSASQAISPAIERTKNYLFRPFAWGTYLKLSVVACITGIRHVSTIRRTNIFVRLRLFSRSLHGLSSVK